MLRAIIVFILVLAVVGGGLLLLRRTAGTRPKTYKRRPDSNDDSTGW